MNPFLIPTVLFALAPAAFSESDPGARTGEPPLLEPYEKPFSISFEEPVGLRQFVAKVQDILAGENLNVMIAPEVEDRVIPPLNLRNVSLVGVMETLGPICGILVSPVAGVRDPVDGILAIGAAPGFASALATEPSGRPLPITPPPALVTQTFSVRGIREKDVEQIVAETRFTWSDLAASSPERKQRESRLKFMRSAEILIVQATPDQATVAEAIITGMTESLTRDHRLAEESDLREQVYASRKILESILESGTDNNHTDVKLLQARIERLEKELIQIEFSR